MKVAAQITPLTSSTLRKPKRRRIGGAVVFMTRAPTAEMKVNFLRAVRQATLTAEAKVVKAGSTLGYVECEVKDEQGRLVAKAASTCLKRKRE